MCNLYSMTSTQQAIIDLVKAILDRTGNMPPLPGIFPDYPAPIVRNTAGGRELTMARWGMPTSQTALKLATAKRAAKMLAKGNAFDWRSCSAPSQIKA